MSQQLPQGPGTYAGSHGVPPAPPYGVPPAGPHGVPPTGQYAVPTAPHAAPHAGPYAPPYVAPGAPQYAGAVAPRDPGTAALGTVALVLAIAAAAGATLLSAITAFVAAEGAMRSAIGIAPHGIEDFTPAELLSLLTPVREWVLWAEIGFWAGTALGIWALIQGIVAIVRRRGRGQGIAAVVIAAAGPIVFATVVYGVVIAAIATGATAGS